MCLAGFLRVGASDHVCSCKTFGQILMDLGEEGSIEEVELYVPYSIACVAWNLSFLSATGHPSVALDVRTFLVSL